MNQTEFWRIIEMTNYSSAGDGEKQAELLIEYLSQLSEGEILDFDELFWNFHRQACDYRLWDAAIIIEGGCSENGFTDFRSGLIGRGQAIYEAALADPESLVDTVKVGDYFRIEALNYVTQRAYELKTGEEDIPMRELILPKETSSHRAVSNDFSNSEDWPKNYPKLYAKFVGYEGEA